MTEFDNLTPDNEDVSKENKDKTKEKKEKARAFTKIVCRRLPPSMTQETFLEQVAPIPDYDYFYFANPDLTLTPDLFSRAYINFVNAEDVFLFRDKFDDYIFLDEKGNEYSAIVEYAPFQRVPKKRRKKDPKSGTLENDPTYLEFLENLKETDSDCREPKMEYSFQLTEEKKETTTPLLEFLASKRRDEKRRKEERQRRRVRSRNTKEDDIIEEDNIKKIKPRDVEKSKDGGKGVSKKKEDDSSNLKSEHSEIKERQSSRSSKGFQKKSDDLRKKSDDKKDLKNSLGESGEIKLNRKERRERQREAAVLKAEKGKDIKKYSDFKKDKGESKSNQSYRKIEEAEQEEILSSVIDGNANQKNIGSSCKESENPKTKLLQSSDIKPFTQLPQYKGEDLTKAIEELDKAKKEEPINKQEMGDCSLNDTFPAVIKTKEPSKTQQRRNSLESMDAKNSPDDSPLRRHKSLDDKSQDESSEKDITDKGKSRDHKKECRVRNKDRPSIVIYQPGMGKFSKQRIDRGKDSTPGTYKPLDPTP